MSRSPVVVFEKLLVSPEIEPGVPVRQQIKFEISIANQPDVTLAIRQWLTLRNSVFPSTARPWTEREFQREFASKKWWSYDRLLFAYHLEQVVGAAVLGEYAVGEAKNCCGSIQWLMTANGFRRRGIASALLSQLETIAILEFGYSRIRLDTLRE